MDKQNTLAYPYHQIDREPFVRQREFMGKCMPLARFHQATGYSMLPPKPPGMDNIERLTNWCPIPPKPIGLENIERLRKMLTPPAVFRR